MNKPHDIDLDVPWFCACHHKRVCVPCSFFFAHTIVVRYLVESIVVAMRFLLLCIFLCVKHLGLEDIPVYISGIGIYGKMAIRLASFPGFIHAKPGNEVIQPEAVPCRLAAVVECTIVGRRS